MNLSLKSILKKAGFIVLLVGLGFSFEYIYYRKQNKFLPKEGQRNVLLVGGSILRSVAPALKTVSEQMQIREFEFTGLITHFLSSQVARQEIAEAVPKINPEAVFLLVGMNEHEKSVILLEQDERKKLSKYASKRDAKGMNHFLVKKLDEYYHSHDSKLYSFTLLLWTIPVRSLLDTKILMPWLLGKMDGELNSKTPDTKKFLELQDIAFVLKIQANIPLNKYHIFPGEFHHFLSKGSELIRKKGCPDSSYPGFGVQFTTTDWRWLCYVSKISGGENVVDVIDESPMLLSPFLQTKLLPLMAKGSGPEEKRLIGIMNKYIAAKPKPNFNDLKGSDHFVRNVSAIKDFLSEKGIKLFLLHYPAVNYDSITALSEKLNIKVIDGASAFSGRMTPGNRHLYFVDDLYGSGHMTVLGSEMYARSIIDQTPELFKK